MPSSVNGCTSHVGEQDNNYDYIEMGNVTFNTITHSNQSFIHFFQIISTLQWKEFILYESYDFATYERNDAVLTQWFDAFDENTAITMFEICLVEFAEICKLCTFQSSSIKR